MKKMLFFTLLSTALGVTSCTDNNQTGNTTTNADTAVLVNDPANNLNAAPVNDTVIADTVMNQSR